MLKDFDRKMVLMIAAIVGSPPSHDALRWVAVDLLLS